MNIDDKVKRENTELKEDLWNEWLNEEWGVHCIVLMIIVGLVIIVTLIGPWAFGCLVGVTLGLAFYDDVIDLFPKPKTTREVLQNEYDIAEKEGDKELMELFGRYLNKN